MTMLANRGGCGAVDRLGDLPILTPLIGRRSTLPSPQICCNRHRLAFNDGSRMRGRN